MQDKLSAMSDPEASVSHMILGNWLDAHDPDLSHYALAAKGRR